VTGDAVTDETVMDKTVTKTIFAAVLAIALPAGAIAQEGAKRGEKVFDECRACHTIDGSNSAVGPSLRGVLGRKAGTLDDFRYSPAMKRAEIVWTRQTLDAFIADPQKLVPANRMPYSGIPDAKNRADVIEYLQTLK
jgi:cytochrome c